MKNNYNIEFNKICESCKDLEPKPKLLLHSCCGPCSSAVIERVVPYFQTTIYYYNPNIEPKSEYELRKQEQIRLIKELASIYPVAYLDCDYDNEIFLAKTCHLANEKEGGARCPICFNLRLTKTAETASKLGFDYFGTTLTVSPHKNSQIINQIGETIADQYPVKFLYSDFKKENGYLRSIELAKKYNLYRQKYCGCHYANKIEE